MASTTRAQNLAASYGPSETALLLLDLQNFILGGIQDAASKEKLFASAKALLTAARENNVPILHCHIDVNRAPMPTSKLAERWVNEYVPVLAKNPAAGSAPAEIAMLEGAANEFHVTRVPGRVSAFQSEGILPLLREKLGVKSLVICGVVSTGCVLSTGRGGTDEDFVVTVVSDACWDRTEEKHRAVMEDILPMTTNVVGLDQALEILKGSGASK